MGGADVLKGGGGNDVLLAVDWSRDISDGGGGSNMAQVDSGLDELLNAVRM